MCRNDESTKTRIETNHTKKGVLWEIVSRNDESTKTRIETSGLADDLVYVVRRNDESTKTRIETTLRQRDDNP